MLRVQRDEAGAYAELVRTYWPRVFGRFVRWLGDRQDAEDLAQEVFLRLYRARLRYQPRAKFATWLFHITKNVARNALRSRKRRPCVRLGALLAAGQEAEVERVLTAGSDSPSQPLERSELARVVRDAVSGLGGRQRTALELYQFEDRSYAEIAAKMAMSPKAAKSLLYRARNQLRAHLTRLMGTP
jgi:RNA polymerase sigma-70 factor (ECF subfamily)